MLGMPSGPPRTPSNMAKEEAGHHRRRKDRIDLSWSRCEVQRTAATRIVRPAAHSPLTMCGRITTPEGMIAAARPMHDLQPPDVGTGQSAGDRRPGEQETRSFPLLAFDLNQASLLSIGQGLCITNAVSFRTLQSSRQFGRKCDHSERRSVHFLRESQEWPQCAANSEAERITEKRPERCRAGT